MEPTAQSVDVISNGKQAEETACDYTNGECESPDLPAVNGVTETSPKTAVESEVKDPDTDINNTDPIEVKDKSVQASNGQKTNKKEKKKDKTAEEEKKLVDLLLHVFDGLETPEKKMEALAKKYIQLAADHKTTEAKYYDVEAKHKELSKDKEQLEANFIKVNSAKTKLESLCRELQKQNKLIKDETQRRADEEDRKRKELSQKFQTTINDITNQMGENHKRNQQLKQDNSDLAQKLKGLVEQYEVREQHIEKVLKAKQLELQLCEAKLQQQTLLLQEERENSMKEKHVLLQESLDQKKKCEELLKQEVELRGQLALYTDKFEEFQTTLTKSNEVFATFKKEMDKMTKTIRKLEKESTMWKSKCENTHRSLLQMVEERTQKDNELATQKGKLEKLEKLCRALQQERKKLKKEVDQLSGKTSPKSGQASPREADAMNGFVEQENEVIEDKGNHDAEKQGAACGEACEHADNDEDCNDGKSSNDKQNQPQENAEPTEKNE